MCALFFFNVKYIFQGWENEFGIFPSASLFGKRAAASLWPVYCKSEIPAAVDPAQLEKSHFWARVDCSGSASLVCLSWVCGHEGHLGTCLMPLGPGWCHGLLVTRLNLQVVPRLRSFVSEALGCLGEVPILTLSLLSHGLSPHNQPPFWGLWVLRETAVGPGTVLPLPGWPELALGWPANLNDLGFSEYCERVARIC